MTPSPLLPLRAAIRSACLADAALAPLMGGTATLHDEPPRGALPLYAMFGDVAARDHSTATDRGHEQDLAIVVWARPGSTATAVMVAERMAGLLDDATLALDGHRLVLLRVASLGVERDEDSDLARATLRLSAITEVKT